MSLTRIYQFVIIAPEIEEIEELSRQYYAKRDELKVLNAKIAEIEESVDEFSSQLTTLNDKYKQLSLRE